MSREFQDKLNDVVSAFAEGVTDECRAVGGLDAEELDSGMAAALINAAAAIMLRRGSKLDDVFSLVEDHAAALRPGVH